VKKTVVVGRLKEPTVDGRVIADLANLDGSPIIVPVRRMTGKDILRRRSVVVTKRGNEVVASVPWWWRGVPNMDLAGGMAVWTGPTGETEQVVLRGYDLIGLTYAPGGRWAWNDG